MRFTLAILLSVLTASAANMVPNSSFEAGYGRGWIPFQTGNSGVYGNRSFISGLMTNIAFHGGSSFVIPREARVLSRAFWLTNGTWCLSYYARSASGSSGGGFRAYVYREYDLYAVTPPFQSATMTGTYTRYTTNITVTTNAFYKVKLYNVSSDVFIDAVQVELGSSPTTYAPQSTVECGIALGGTFGMFFTGDTPTFNFILRNEGASATNARVAYEVFDTWNSNLVTATVLVTCAASASATNTVTLPTRTGWLRVVSRLLDFPDSYDESHTIVYPHASNTVGNATNDWLGGHPYSSTFHVRHEMLAGRHFGRKVGPDYFNTRWDVVEPTRGNMTFYAEAFSNCWANGMLLIGPLTPTDGGWPTWATNADGTWDRMAVSNFAFRCVQTNGPYVYAWELGNEPYQSMHTGFGPYADIAAGDPHAGGTNLPINLRVATNYTKYMAALISGITNADPNAKIIAMAGAYGNGDWSWEAWTNLSADLQSWVTAVSTHIYTEDQRFDPNDAFYTSITVDFSHPVGWANTWRGIRPVWNTESGAYGAGYVQGLNGLFARTFASPDVFPGIYDPMADFASEGIVNDSYRSEALNRSITETARCLSTALRCLGFGFEKFIYYDSREFTDDSLKGTQPYPTDYLQVDRPELVSLAIAQEKFVRRGFGPISNAFVLLEMYMYTNGIGQSVVAAWNAGRTNLTLTLDNAAFAQYDVMGNLLQTNALTAKVSRVPTYFVSGTRTVVQLSNTFRTCSVAHAADILAPQVSIDVAPTGTGWDTNRVLFKWTAVDDFSYAWPTNVETLSSRTATNVMYRWKLDSGSYTPYSQSNHVWMFNLTPTNHNFYVTAKDTTGNAQEWRYEFSTPITNTTILNVSGTANIGTITVISQ